MDEKVPSPSLLYLRIHQQKESMNHHLLFKFGMIYVYETSRVHNVKGELLSKSYLQYLVREPIQVRMTKKLLSLQSAVKKICITN